MDHSGFSRILIIEDSDDDYETTVRAFKKANRLVNPIYRCQDGDSALDYLFQRGQFEDPESAPRPGIILLDLNLPGLDGSAVLREIKNDDHFKSIPIIVLTTSDDPKDIDSCYQDGANTFIMKPVELDKFFAAIKSLDEYWFGISILPNGSRVGYTQ